MWLQTLKFGDILAFIVKNKKIVQYSWSKNPLCRVLTLQEMVLYKKIFIPKQDGLTL